MKRFFLLTAFLIFFSFESGAQDISKETHWVQQEENAEAKRLYEANYDKRGNILSFNHFFHNSSAEFSYDAFGRLLKEIRMNGETSLETSYSYKDNVEIAITDTYIGSQATRIRIAKFFDDTKHLREIIHEQYAIPEEGEQLPELISKKRTVFTYNELDSLSGITTYEDSSTLKTLHKFDMSTGKKLQTLEYNHEEKLTELTDYIYNAEGRVSEIRIENRDRKYYVKALFSYNKEGLLSSETVVRTKGKEHIPIRIKQVNYLYDGPQLHERIENFLYFTQSDSQYANRQVSIYKNGRLIRDRIYDNENTLDQIVDYQYEFFEAK